MAEAKPKPFDPANEQDVVLLQAQLNRYNALSGRTDAANPPLKLTGKMDAATKEAWLTFKKDTFADGSLNTGYLTDTLKFSRDELVALGVSKDALPEAGKPPKNPAAYDRDKPPAALVKAVQKKLGVEQTGKMDKATLAAVQADKRERWIDGRTNAGALEMLKKTVRSLEAARDTPNPGVSQAAGNDGENPAAPTRGGKDERAPAR